MYGFPEIVSASTDKYCGAYVAKLERNVTKLDYVARVAGYAAGTKSIG